MKPLNHHETHYTSKIRDYINAQQRSPEDWSYIAHVDRIEGLSTTDGMADMVGWTVDQKYVAVEVKKMGGKFSHLQVKFLDSAPLAYVARVFKDDDNKVWAEILHWPDMSPIGFTIYLGRERG